MARSYYYGAPDCLSIDPPTRLHYTVNAPINPLTEGGVCFPLFFFRLERVGWEVIIAKDAISIGNGRLPWLWLFANRAISSGDQTKLILCPGVILKAIMITN